MRYKVGFFTSRHPEIDGREIGQSFVVLQAIDLNAPSVAEAVRAAKGRVNLDLLRAELTRRFPTAKVVNYTVQRMGKNQPRTWMRSFLSWRIIE